MIGKRGIGPDNESLWLADAPSTGLHASGAVPSRADVVVIGAGMAGMCTAALCVDAGASVVVVEAGTIAGRTTGHSTAKLTALHGLTYASLARGKGAEAAARYASGNVEALLRVRELVERLQIDCALTDAVAYTCAATTGGVRAIEEEANAARAAGLHVDVVDETELPLTVKRAVALGGQAHFDPVAFCRGLADDLRSRGALVLEGVRVTDVAEEVDGCRVIGDGLSIDCDVAVITTHLPIVDPAFLSGRVRPQRSYVVAGPMVDASTTPSGMYLCHDEGWSVRPTASKQPTLLVGGEGHPMTDHVDTARHYANLEGFASDRLGVDVQYRWSAFDYMTTDGVPFIGRLAPRSKRRFVATGMRKWGMTNGMLAGIIISDLINGRANPYLETFDATRVAPTVTRDLVSNSAKVASRFVVDRIKARTGDDSGNPPVGEGRVMAKGRATLAVSTDRLGVTRTLDAVCPHMGCIVAFNDGDQTWDCPCHGSRFGLDGSVIDGPATEPLKPR